MLAIISNISTPCIDSTVVRFTCGDHTIVDLDTFVVHFDAGIGTVQPECLYKMSSHVVLHCNTVVTLFPYYEALFLDPLL